MDQTKEERKKPPQNWLPLIRHLFLLLSPSLALFTFFAIASFSRSLCVLVCLSACVCVFHSCASTDPAETV